VEFNTQRLPFVDDALLEYLERLHPDQAPEPSDDSRKIWMNRGAVGVIRHLRLLHQEQRKNMLGE
jgi:hypothetical protein